MHVEWKKKALAEQPMCPMCERESVSVLLLRWSLEKSPDLWWGLWTLIRKNCMKGEHIEGADSLQWIITKRGIWENRGHSFLYPSGVLKPKNKVSGGRVSLPTLSGQIFVWFLVWFLPLWSSGAAGNPFWPAALSALGFVYCVVLCMSRSFTLDS